MIRLSRLAASLARKHGISQRAAERFLATMAEVMNDGLHYDKTLKVKGLGSFKVTSVNARESVNVNTGERILIDGREKITFTPEQSMRDFVNKPFAQFETVVVNDGVDFDAIDKKYALTEEIANEEEDSTETAGESIIELVENEDKRKPLSDEKLCSLLQERGHNIKRRTVAKYRESLLIPVARQRKTL